MHEVQPLQDGTRFAVPSFFTTCPVAPELMGSLPGDDASIAAELWRTLLAAESVPDFRTFMMKWHALLAPGR